MATATAAPEYIGPDEELEEEVEESSSLSKIEEADRSHMIRTAKQNPRSVTKFIKELTEIACFNRETAMEMMYSIPRDGKQLVGPSIGFAEAALAVWGNARAGSEVVETNAHEGYVIAEGRFYDCEKNVGRAIRKRRRVVAKRITGDALQVTGDAACSIATREAILRSIPKPLWKPIWEQAKKTAVGDVKSVAQVRTGLVDGFHKMGVTDTQLLNALQVQGMADIGGDEIIAMQSWKKQLEERAVTLEEIFGSPDDAAIEKLMEAMEWTPQKRKMAWESYKGRREELLTYLRTLAKEAGITITDPEKAAPKAEPQPKEDAAKAETSEQATDAKPEATKQPAAASGAKRSAPAW